MDPLVASITIPLSAVLSICFGAWLWWRVSFVSTTAGQSTIRSMNGREYLLEEEQRGDDEVGMLVNRMNKCMSVQDSNCLILASVFDCR